MRRCGDKQERAARVRVVCWVSAEGEGGRASRKFLASEGAHLEEEHHGGDVDDQNDDDDEHRDIDKGEKKARKQRELLQLAVAVGVAGDDPPAHPPNTHAAGAARQHRL